MEDIYNIAGRIHSTSQEAIAVVANEVYDPEQQKRQSEINSIVASLNHEDYVNYSATEGDTLADILPSTGAVNRVYRVANWKGDGNGDTPVTYYNVNCYSEYVWNASTSDYTLLSVSDRGIDATPIPGSDNLVKSNGISKYLLPLFQISNSIGNFVIDGEYYNVSNGNINFADTYSRLPKLDVAGSTKIYCANDTFLTMATCVCYDSNGNFLGSAAKDHTTLTYTLVDGTKYVGITWNHTSYSNYDNTYLVFSTVIEQIYSRLSSIEELDSNLPIDELRILFKNTFYLNDYFLDNKYYSNGNLADDTTHRYAATQKIPVDCTYVKINGFVRNDCNCWNGDTFLGVVPWNNSTDKKFTLKEGTTHIAFSFLKESQPEGYRENGIIFNFEPYVPLDALIQSIVSLENDFDQLDDVTVKRARTYNLYDKDTMFVANKVLDNAGHIVNQPGYGISDYISVEANTEYYLSASYWARTTNFAWFDSSKNLLQMDASTTMQGTHTSPADAAYFVCVLEQNNVMTEDFMIAKSSAELPYQAYYKLDKTNIVVPENIVKGAVTTDKVANDAVTEIKLSPELRNKINPIKGLRIVKKSESGTNAIYIYDTNGLDCFMAWYPDNSYNKTFNFRSLIKDGVSYSFSDDIPAVHILNTTLGGNHAQPIIKATISSHGFTNEDIGTAWVFSGNNKTYYIVKIFDANNIGLLSANEGTYNSPQFVGISGTGTITDGTITKTITAVTASQMWPGVQNVNIKFLVDGKEIALLTENFNKDFYGSVIDIVESYEITNPVSVLNNLIANAGSSAAPSYEGTSCLRAEHTFRVQEGLNVLFLTNYVVLEELAFSDYLFAMRKPYGTLSNIKYYIPNSKPLSVDGGVTYTFDCRTPSNFPTGTSSAIWVDSTRKENADYPINRVLQFNTANNCGVAMGIFTEIGVGKKLDNYTEKYFELRYNAGSIYPQPVRSSKVGTVLQQGDIYTGIMYWGFFDADLQSPDNRMSMYHFLFNGAEYVYIDYKGSKLDRIVLNDSFNGKTIEVIESSNAALVNMNGDNSTDDIVNNIYNGGFYVNANYVNGETCYIVCRIK